MRRREFIGLVSGTALWPLATRAQQPRRMARIGVLLVSGPELMGPFRESLHELGYAEGKNIQIEVRSAQNQLARLPELATQLVRSQVDVIVAIQTPAVYAAKNATRDIPIVMMAGDPIGTGLISNLARPGGNLTGLSGAAAELAAKSLELIPQMIPAARYVGVLGNANDPFMKPFLEDIEQAAPKVRLEVHEIIVRSGSELDDAFAALARAQADAVMIQGSLSDKLAVDLALKYRMPSLSTQNSAVQAGLLMSYTADLTERGQEIAQYVDRILKGTKPGDLPVQQPTRYELAINLKTAKALGLAVPPVLLARADKVIE
ncbi:ABC transporter substrate-binding protein [Bradyrhizobium sp. CCBAU 53338]|uniref:ABC transporter substrate-binding protein n=1 Tax=Bradyrhizobium sp. CCBAU 53338 TaxID=1325111 RepID=UPI00188CA5D8|nr:ABC transporter substrate-binding protein [Bradyrhizobium sp. CCBAU 53338]QOZ51880.1 ABC transporter substrate-binding protein [Bradyrhizobium sp. CCBAU 53338]